jgi:hypothetical protein
LADGFYTTGGSSAQRQTWRFRKLRNFRNLCAVMILFYENGALPRQFRAKFVRIERCFHRSKCINISNLREIWTTKLLFGNSACAPIIVDRDLCRSGQMQNRKTNCRTGTWNCVFPLFSILCPCTTTPFHFPSPYVAHMRTLCALVVLIVFRLCDVEGYTWNLVDDFNADTDDNPSQNGT